MDSSAKTAVGVALQYLLLCGTGCDVYDPSLAHQPRSAVRQARDADSEDTPDHEDSGATDDDAGEECGDGLVTEGERCDVAIARGQAGACPEGCSGREGCSQRVLVGSGCTARCESVRITSAVPDDGCCPSEANGTIDNDCASSCGNSVVERGERCDPPETCPRADACKARAACEEAIYRGDPEQCSASCELRKLERCVSGDGCCPAGCSAEADQDCKPASNCDAGCEPPATATCSQRHSGGECETCDCQQCAAAAVACADAPGRNGSARCEAIARCAAQNRCTGVSCYCAGLDAQACRRQPFVFGPCATELRAATDSDDIVQLILQSIESATVDGALPRAVRLLECRAANCKRACRL